MARVKQGPRKTQMLADRLGLDVFSAWTRGQCRYQGTDLYLRDGRVAHWHAKSRMLTFSPMSDEQMRANRDRIAVLEDGR